MFRMYASNYHSYTHLIRALGIVREPTVCWFVTSEYPGIHDIGQSVPGQVRGEPPHAAAPVQERVPEHLQGPGLRRLPKARIE